MEQKLYNALCKFMEHQTKDYVWYYDTPEQRFEITPGSIWLINPKTKKWVVELQKSGWLWWYWGFYLNFQRYFNMERSDFERFITIWMEDVLNRGVSTTLSFSTMQRVKMEDVLNKGVYIKNCMGVDGGIKNNNLYLMNKLVFDDFQNKVDELVIEHIFNTP